MIRPNFPRSLPAISRSGLNVRLQAHGVFYPWPRVVLHDDSCCHFIFQDAFGEPRQDRSDLSSLVSIEGALAGQTCGMLHGAAASNLVFAGQAHGKHK
jgi:hypothetical protein